MRKLLSSLLLMLFVTSGCSRTVDVAPPPKTDSITVPAPAESPVADPTKTVPE